MRKREYVKQISLGLNGENYRQVLTTLEKGYKGLYVILKVIRNNNGEVIAGDIASELNISTARVAVALKTLEKKKYIVKHKGKDDARKTVVSLTKLGSEVLENREKEIIDLIEKLLSNLSDNEIEQLINIIDKVKGSRS